MTICVALVPDQMLDDVAFAQREKNVQGPAPALCHGPKVRELPLRLLCTIHQQLAWPRVSLHLPGFMSPCTPCTVCPVPCTMCVPVLFVCPRPFFRF